MSQASSIDPVPPPLMAVKAEEIGVKKAQMPVSQTFVLSILAGAFIALGGMFMVTVTAGNLPIKLPDGSLAYTTAFPYGVTRLLGGLAFSLGLILVVVGGAELFTGNNLILIAFASGKVTLGQLLRNWILVYLGNFVGSLITAGLVFLSRQHLSGSGAIGLNLLSIGEAKTSLDPLQAVVMGILCNVLVCLAVWLTYSARSTTDKILAMIPPITAFVAAGFEHSVANMYLLPLALWVKETPNPAFFELIHKTPADFAHLSWNTILLANLLPVTLGNIIGGALLVGGVYWFVYLRQK